MTMIDTDYLQDVLVRSLARPTSWTPAGERSDAIQEFLAAFLAVELRSMGCTSLRSDSTGNLLATVAGQEPRSPATLFITYVMTHPAGTMSDAWRPAVLDGERYGFDGTVVRGRGACEQRGPMASVLAALKAVLDEGRPRASIMLLALCSGETGTHDAVATALRELPIDAGAAVLAVCTDRDVIRAHKGRVDIRVRAYGRAVHSSAPDQGDNAIEIINRALSVLQFHDLGAPHPELGRRTMTPTSVRSSPEAVHTVPATCELILDYRLLPGDHPQDVARTLSILVQGHLDQRVTIEAGPAMLPSDLAADSPLIRAIQSAAARAGVPPRRARSMAAATDTGYLNSRGIPAVCLGPGEVSRAHTDEDVIAMRDAVEVAEIYHRLMRDGVSVAAADGSPSKGR